MIEVLGLSRDTWELLSFIVTVFALPVAIFVFVFEQRKERDNEEENVYQLLSDNYQDFLKIALDNSDLHLLGIRIWLCFLVEAHPLLFDLKTGLCCGLPS